MSNELTQAQLRQVQLEIAAALDEFAGLVSSDLPSDLNIVAASAYGVSGMLKNQQPLPSPAEPPADQETRFRSAVLELLVEIEKAYPNMLNGAWIPPGLIQVANARDRLRAVIDEGTIVSGESSK